MSDWDADEIAILRTHYPQGKARKVRTILLNRTIKEIHAAAVHYGCAPLARMENVTLCLIAEGDTQREIADSLDLALPTVSETVSRILFKLQARTSAHAVYIAVSRGLIPIDTPATNKTHSAP